MGIGTRLSFPFIVSLFSDFFVSNILLRISYYATASTDSAAYIIGGLTGSEQTSIIAEFKNNKWLKIGDLNESKNSPSAILHNGEYMIVGGFLGPGKTGR